MLYNTGRNVGHTETYNTKFQKPKGTQNNLDPKNKPRPTEASRQMFKGTNRKGNVVKGKHCLELALHNCTL